MKRLTKTKFGKINKKKDRNDKIRSVKRMRKSIGLKKQELEKAKQNKKQKTFQNLQKYFEGQGNNADDAYEIHLSVYKGFE